MKKLLLLARGSTDLFVDIHGNSILKDFPVPVIVFAEKNRAKFFQEQGENIEVEVVRFYDEASIHERAQQIHEASGLLGVGVIEEHAINLAAEIREKLNLPGMHVKDADLFRDKMLMKKALAAKGVRVPENVCCSNREQVEKLLEKHRKIVIKPIDGLGSKGVAFIENSKELTDWYENNKVKNFEAEEYIEGTLYHVNAVVQDGKAVLTASAPYLPGMGNIDFASGAPFVSAMLKNGELKARLENMSDDVVSILGMQYGVTHLECFLKPDGELVFCEVGARPGGGGIVLMMEAQYGVNYARASLLLEIDRGDLLSINSNVRSDVVGLMGFRQPESVFIKRIARPEKFDESCIHHVKIDKKESDFVAAAAHCTDYIGLLIFSAQDFNKFEEKREELYNRFYADLETQLVA
jgi:biotin carboxylase